MTGAELQTALEELFGPRWRTDAPAEIGFDPATLYRQVKSDKVNPVLAWGIGEAQSLAVYRRYRNTSQQNYRAKQRADSQDDQP